MQEIHRHDSAHGGKKGGITRVTRRRSLERFIYGVELDHAGARLAGWKKSSVWLAKELMIVQQLIAVIAVVCPIAHRSLLRAKAVQPGELSYSILHGVGYVLHVKDECARGRYAPYVYRARIVLRFRIELENHVTRRKRQAHQRRR
jgi:hypothetical protein